jgi:stress response protein YsnF
MEDRYMTASGMNDLHELEPLGLEVIRDFDVFDASKHKLGKVVAIERSDVDQSSFIVIKIGSWLSSREVLIPLRHYQVDLKQRHIYLNSVTKESVERLGYSSAPIVQPLDVAVEASLPLESAALLEEPVVRSTPAYASSATVHEPRSNVEPLHDSQEKIKELSNQNILAEKIVPLLSERVVVDRHKRKSGEVVVRKVIETEVVEVIVRREKLIVEQVSPSYKELAVIDLGRSVTERVKTPEE